MKRKGFEAEDHTKNIIKNMVKEKKIPNELLLELRKKVLSRLLNKSNGIMIWNISTCLCVIFEFE